MQGRVGPSDAGNITCGARVGLDFQCFMWAVPGGGMRDCCVGGNPAP